MEHLITGTGFAFETPDNKSIQRIWNIRKQEKVTDMEHLKTGEVISKRRRELGLTQGQLAKSLNISFQAVSKWENGVSHS